VTTYIQGTDDFPVEFPEIDDSTPEEAAEWNPALEALANRTKWLKLKILPIPALNWHKAVTTNFNQTRGVYSEVEQTWYIVGDDPGTDQFERSQDSALNNFEDLSGALGGAIPCYDVACNQTTGDLVIVNKSSRNVYLGVFAGYGSLSSGGNWTNGANMIAVAAGAPVVDWDEISGNFITVYRNGASGFHAEHWAAGPTFTPAASIPAAWTAYTGSNNAEIGCSRGQPVGTTLACFYDATGSVQKLNVMRSTDGGTNWTNHQIAPPLDLLLVSKPAFNKEAKRWYVAGSSSLPRVYIYESTDDGVTWAIVATINGWECHGIVASGELLVLLGKDQRIAYSVDRGVTWRFEARRLPATVATMHLLAGGGQLFFTNNVAKNAFSSLRIGNVGEVI